ncbi:MAG: amino acid ABC transporter permease [Deltaproteobacteria bacterium]|jgi:polar amino acid transport system permease protein|nr:amino acid ABC transporter permease [Deltaproteobacteria bacterium]
MSIFDSSLISAAFWIAKGTGLTVALIVGAMFLGLIVGLPMAAIQVYGPRWARFLVMVYVWFFRGIPILVLLFLFYFGVFSPLEAWLTKFFGVRINLPFLASVTTLGLASGAYQSQIFRGAMLSLHMGQYEAALSLGFTRLGALVNIILPQALRIAIPAWANEYSILLKDSAIAYVLGTLEIMSRIKLMVATFHMHVPFYILAGFIYYFLTWLGIKALKKLEAKTRIPGLGSDGDAHFPEANEEIGTDERLEENPNAKPVPKPA